MRYVTKLFSNTWPWFDFKFFELILLKNRSKDFFAVFLSAFSGGWAIIINHKSHSILSLNYTEGSLNSGGILQYWNFFKTKFWAFTPRLKKSNDCILRAKLEYRKLKKRKHTWLTFSIEEDDHFVAREGDSIGSDLGDKGLRMSAGGEELLAHVTHEVVDQIILFAKSKEKRFADPRHRLIIIGGWGGGERVLKGGKQKCKHKIRPLQCVHVRQTRKDTNHWIASYTLGVSERDRSARNSWNSRFFQ